MKTVSPDFCASFGIELIYGIDEDKDTTGMKYLLPGVKLPSGVPFFQTAIDIVSMQKSGKYVDLYCFEINGYIATANKLGSAVERVYLRYIVMRNLRSLFAISI